jgi:hypothetical protein
LILWAIATTSIKDLLKLEIAIYSEIDQATEKLLANIFANISNIVH